MLYLVATPIGNLKDITFRAIEILGLSDYILCEDTRHSLVLLNHYAIQKPLKSFHKFNEAAKENEIIEDLRNGKIISLISDAGSPAISDPGTRLVQACIEQGLTVSTIPGPTAAIAAISCSGLNTERFQFYGFLPRKSGELLHSIQSILLYPHTTICYESPNRLEDVLKLLKQLAPKRKIVIARELTKKFEEILRGGAEELLSQWKATAQKGEIVLLIEGEKQILNWSELSLAEHLAYMQEAYGLSKQEAIKMVAEMRGLPKREVYNKLLSD